MIKVLFNKEESDRILGIFFFVKHKKRCEDNAWAYNLQQMLRAIKKYAYSLSVMVLFENSFLILIRKCVNCQELEQKKILLNYPSLKLNVFLQYKYVRLYKYLF